MSGRHGCRLVTARAREYQNRLQRPPCSELLRRRVHRLRYAVHQSTQLTGCLGFEFGHPTVVARPTHDTRGVVERRSAPQPERALVPGDAVSVVNKLGRARTKPLWPHVFPRSSSCSAETAGAGQRGQRAPSSGVGGSGDFTRGRSTVSRRLAVRLRRVAVATRRSRRCGG